jgi:hypothetical protein
LLDTLPVIDLLALAWLLLGVLLGLTRGLAPLFSWLLWVLASLWLAAALAPVIVGWLANTEGANGPQGRFFAYGSLAALSLGLPALGRLLGSRRGHPRKRSPGARDKSLGVVAGIACALLTLTLALPYVGSIERIGRRMQGSAALSTGRTTQQLVPWLFAPPHRDAMDRLARGPLLEEEAQGPPMLVPGNR